MVQEYLAAKAALSEAERKCFFWTSWDIMEDKNSPLPAALIAAGMHVDAFVERASYGGSFLQLVGPRSDVKKFKDIIAAHEDDE